MIDYSKITRSQKSNNDDNDIRAVVEIKSGWKLIDSMYNGETAVEQAFRYARQIKSCEFVLISNFVEFIKFMMVNDIINL